MRRVEIRRMLISQGMGWMLPSPRPIWLGRLRPTEGGRPVKALPVKSKLPKEVKGSNGRTYRLNALGQYQRVRQAAAVT